MGLAKWEDLGWKDQRWGHSCYAGTETTSMSGRQKRASAQFALDRVSLTTAGNARARKGYEFCIGSEETG